MSTPTTIQWTCSTTRRSSLDCVRKTLIDADRFEDILQGRSAGEFYRQYAGQRRYGIDIQNIGAEIKLRAERMRAAGELPYRGMRRHRGNLCPTCFFYRRVSDADEACEAYAKWLVNPPVKREQCEPFISR
jgi:hypothetical protein